MGSETTRDNRTGSAILSGVRPTSTEMDAGEGARDGRPWQTAPKKAGLGQLAKRLHGRAREGGFASAHPASSEDLGEERVDTVLAETAQTWGEQYLLAKWGEARSRELSAEIAASYFRSQRKTLELVMDNKQTRA